MKRNGFSCKQCATLLLLTFENNIDIFAQVRWCYVTAREIHRIYMYGTATLVHVRLLLTAASTTPFPDSQHSLGGVLLQTGRWKTQLITKYVIFVVLCGRGPARARGSGNISTLCGRCRLRAPSINKQDLGRVGFRRQFF